MKKSKILQLTIGLNSTVQQFDLFEEIARGFSNDEYDFTFGVLTGKPDPEVIERLNCKTKFFGFKKKDIAGIFPRAIPPLYRYIKEHNIDVVIIHRYKPAYMLALMALFLPKCRRVVSVFHGLKEFDRKRRQLLGKIFFTEKWRIVGVSQAVVNDLADKGLPANRLALIRNSIDSKALIKNQLTKAEARQKLSLDQKKLVIGTLGRAKPVKGHDLLLQGFAPLCKNNNLHLIIMGGGDFEPALHKMASELGIEERLTITGHLSNGYQYLNALDIFIMPSRSEGLPIAMLEAMATSLPCIGSSVGGIPEALGDDGLVIEPNSVTAITESLEKLINLTEEQRSKLGEGLKQRINEKFSIENYHESYRRLVAE